MQLRNEIKLLQRQHIAESIKENQAYSQPRVTDIKHHSPKMPTKQRPHVIPDKDDIINIPNLVEQMI